MDTYLVYVDLTNEGKSILNLPYKKFELFSEEEPTEEYVMKVITKYIAEPFINYYTMTKENENNQR